MKLLFMTCEECGAPSTSPFGVCRDCEDRRVDGGIAARRRLREQARTTKRVA